MIQEVIDEARHLQRLLTHGNGTYLDPVEQAVSLTRSAENLTAGLVGRARLARVPWAALGPALAMQPDTARRTYRADSVNRRLDHAAQRTQFPHQTWPAAPAASYPNHSRSHLAPVLSGLHRASRLSLRDLAMHMGISSSHASRILSGERFPNWRLTERLARACGADPQVLRRVWEDEKLRDDQEPDTAVPDDSADPQQRLPIALRTLHIRAGRPTYQEMAKRMDRRLTPTQIEAALNEGSPHWQVIATLVVALCGDEPYFYGLWRRAVVGSA
jgi:transcriptional regulator with XRE-family HTH domain